MGAAATGWGAAGAVTAGGLDICYPASNHDLARQIMAKGCLITETPLGTRPEAFRFPARNRIISGLVHAVVVVEDGDGLDPVMTALRRYFRSVELVGEVSIEVGRFPIIETRPVRFLLFRGRGYEPRPLSGEATVAGNP